MCTAGSNVNKILSVAVAILISGCASAVSIKDQAVRRIKSDELKSIIGEDVSSPMIQRQAAEDYIVISFFSEDLRVIAEKHSAIIKAEVRVCKNPNVEYRLGPESIYFRGKPLRGKIGAKNSGKFSGSQRYEVVILPAWEIDWEVPYGTTQRTGQKYYEKFNFYENPQDICLNVKISNMVYQLKSNEILIDGKDIGNLLKSEK